MDILCDSELIFTDAFAQKPFRTFRVDTTAPISSSVNIPNSSGVVAFPNDSSYSDRFIIWRAIGQTLYLEERSLCRTIVRGAMCIEFTRTSIIPGTSVFLEHNLMCIVVPTQSSVHRFYARLMVDPMDLRSGAKEGMSLFNQIDEREFIMSNHSSHIITTNGHAVRAAATHTNGNTRVAYCMAEGHMVVISMPGLNVEYFDEIQYREGGLLTRMRKIGGAGGDGVSDIAGARCGMRNMFYAIYRDGILRAWSEDMTSYSFNFDRPEFRASISEDSLLLLKTYIVDKDVVIALAVINPEHSAVYFVRDNNKKLHYMSSISCPSFDHLLDFGITFDSGAIPRLWLLWKSASSYADCIVQNIDISVSKASIHTLSDWRNVRPYVPPSSASSELNVNDLREFIFNSDLHPFDVVCRSVQICCDNMRCDFQSGNWRELIKFVDNYVRSPEFDSRYNQKTRGSKLSSKDQMLEAEKSFLVSLVSSIEQLMHAARATLGLILIDFPGVSIDGVIYLDRFSVICPADRILTSEIEQIEEPSLSAVINFAIAVKKDPSTIKNNTLTVNEKAVRKWYGLIRIFLNSLDLQTVPKEGKLGTRPAFGGSFTSGVISAMLEHRISSYFSFTSNLIWLMDLFMTETSFNHFVATFASEHVCCELKSKLQKYASLLKRLSLQLDLKISRWSVISSLSTWAISDNDLTLILCEGGATYQDADITMDGEHPSRREREAVEYNDFLDDTVTASVRAFWPLSKTMLLYRMLAMHKSFVVLKKLCRCVTPAPYLTPALRFYSAVAYCGLKHPQRALADFDEASCGIDTQNEALTRALRPIGADFSIPATLGEFYSVAIKFLHEQGHSDEVVRLSTKAIETVTSMDQCTSDIHATLFDHLVNKREWKEALVCVKKNKDDKMRRLALRDLMSRLLFAKEYKIISELPYGELEDQVEGILLSAAREQNISTVPHLYEVIYAYHMHNVDFARAGQVMYTFSLLLEQAPQTPLLLCRRRDVLAACVNVLSLLPHNEKFAWFTSEYVTEIAPSEENETGEESRSKIRRKVIIVKDKTIWDQWIIADARASLLECVQEVPPSEPMAIVEELIRHKEFDKAFDVCRQFDLSIYNLMFAVGRETLMYEFQNPPVTPEWMQLNRRYTEGRRIGDNWSIVRGLLNEAMSIWPSDSRPMRAVVVAILSHSGEVPVWLQNRFVEMDAGGYVRCLIDYDRILPALNVLASVFQEQPGMIENSLPQPMATCSPLAVTAEILKIAPKYDGVHEALQNLNKSLSFYVRHIQNIEKSNNFMMQSSQFTFSDPQFS